MYRQSLFVALAAVFLALVSIYIAAAPRKITIRGHIQDATTAQPVVGTVLVDGRTVAADVTDFSVHLPADGRTHYVEVRARGYLPWKLGFRGKGGYTIEGPVRLLKPQGR